MPSRLLLAWTLTGVVVGGCGPKKPLTSFELAATRAALEADMGEESAVGPETTDEAAVSEDAEAVVMPEGWTPPADAVLPPADAAAPEPETPLAEGPMVVAEEAPPAPVVRSTEELDRMERIAIAALERVPSGTAAADPRLETVLDEVRALRAESAVMARLAEQQRALDRLEARLDAPRGQAEVTQLAAAFEARAAASEERWMALMKTWLDRDERRAREDETTALRSQLATLAQRVDGMSQASARQQEVLAARLVALADTLRDRDAAVADALARLEAKLVERDDDDDDTDDVPPALERK